MTIISKDKNCKWQKCQIAKIKWQKFQISIIQNIKDPKCQWFKMTKSLNDKKSKWKTFQMSVNPEVNNMSIISNFINSK